MCIVQNTEMCLDDWKSLDKSIKELLQKLKHSALQNCEGRIQVKITWK